MKALRNNLYINKDDVYLHKERETIVIEKKSENLKQNIPVHGIQHIMCIGRALVSPQLMEHCAESDTAISFFNAHGKFLSKVVGWQTGNILLRRAQFNLSEAQNLTIAQSMIAAKIQSSRNILQRHCRNHKQSKAVEEANLKLKRVHQHIRSTKDLDHLRGLEGEAASVYFSVFNDLILNKDSGFSFHTRTRRPPKDAVNAMLSFLYSILTREISSALQSVGLDPQAGCMHADRPGRDSLALDILEEFRAFIVDKLVLSMINRGQFDLKDFETSASKGVKMSDSARKSLLAFYQERRNEQIMHPFMKEKVSIGLLSHIQAMLLAKHIRGDLKHYPPFISPA